MMKQVDFPVSCILLAAGESKRMGKNKLLLPFGSHSIIEEVMKTINSIPFREKIIVVPPMSHIAALATQYNFQVFENPDFKSGIHSSIKAGILVAKEETYLIALGDMPQLKRENFIDLMEAYFSAKNKSICKPLVGDIKGNPTIIHATHKEEILLHANQDSGCQYLFQNHKEKSIFLNSDNFAYLRDIDTKKDYLECVN